MRLISWKINGLRASIKKRFLGCLTELDAGIHQSIMVSNYCLVRGEL